ncbi:MAG: citrate synthase [Thermoprotei archaeon]
MDDVIKGLEDVNIKWTRLTSVDGEKGILRYVGYDIEEIVDKRASAEEIQYLFLNGELPTGEELERFKEKLEEGYDLPDYVIDSITGMPRSSDVVGLQMQGMSSLAATSHLGWNAESNRDLAAKVIGQMAAITSVSIRHVLGKKPELPWRSDGFSKSFLRAVFDKEPTEKQAWAMNTVNVLYMDHEVPASTTAGLVAVSTLADLYSGVVAALAAFKGPMHGGAVDQVVRQLIDIGDPENVEEWFNKNVVLEKKKLMGFGHRVYKTYDPRARILRSVADSVALTGDSARLLQVAKALEKLGISTMGTRGIYPNADFYSGLVYMGIGFPPSNGIYPALFAVSRVTGWIAHFIEYVENQHRLIRPRAVYVGPGERKFPALAERHLIIGGNY